MTRFNPGISGLERRFEFDAGVALNFLVASCVAQKPVLT